MSYDPCMYAAQLAEQQEQNHLWSHLALPGHQTAPRPCYAARNISLYMCTYLHCKHIRGYTAVCFIKIMPLHLTLVRRW